jgi:hypothetical protein
MPTIPQHILNKFPNLTEGKLRPPWPKAKPEQSDLDTTLRRTARPTTKKKRTMPTYGLHASEREWLIKLFNLAEGYGGGARRARSLLLAWYNGAEYGGFDFADLWSLDPEGYAAAVNVILLIMRVPQGTYPNDLGFKDRIEALAKRHHEESSDAT